MADHDISASIAPALPADVLPLARFGFDPSFGGDFGPDEEGPYVLLREVQAAAWLSNIALTRNITGIAQRVYDEADQAQSFDEFAQGKKAGIEALEQALLSSGPLAEAAELTVSAIRVAAYLEARTKGGITGDHIHGMFGTTPLLVSDLLVLLTAVQPQLKGGA